jgi:alcohol dehydrogenase class IV
MSAPAASLQLPPTIAFGAGVSLTAGEHAQRLRATRVLLVTDGFLLEHGPARSIQAAIEKSGVTVTVFSDVQPDPTDENVREGVAALRESRSEALIAVGGGSVIDAAKMISVLSANPEPLSQYAGYHKIPAPGLPLIAIPTTAGTGSEATRVTVITDTSRNTKMMILDRHLVPTVALVDFELSLSMPSWLTAHVGIDTLTHGIEAYVSRLANPMTDTFALSCIALVGQHLEVAWRNPDDQAARAGMALAACQGGLAFSNASVCLVHGMSRPLGAVFHVAHGLSNAVLLPTVTRYSIDGAVGRYAEVARRLGAAPDGIGDAHACERLVNELTGLNERLGVPRLSELHGVEQSLFERSLPKMAEDALASGSPDRNPVVPSAEDIIDLYREAW